MNLNGISLLVSQLSQLVFISVNIWAFWGEINNCVRFKKLYCTFNASDSPALNHQSTLFQCISAEIKAS